MDPNIQIDNLQSRQEDSTKPPPLLKRPRDLPQSDLFLGQPKYCGDPKFKLNCTDDGSPTIYMLSERFVVESMDPERRTLTLVDEDLAGDTCSTPSANTTIDSTAFNFSDQDLNLTLYYECRVEVPLDYRYFFPLPCDPTVADTYAFFTLFPHHNASFASCKVAVITLSKTVSSLLRKGTPLPADAVPSLFRDAVQTGFEVTWEPLDISWCEGCTRSSGRCGYNPDDPQQRVCLCRDQPHQDTCEGPRIKLDGGIRHAHLPPSPRHHDHDSLVSKPNNISSSVGI
ncbi:hypothetical protein ACLOJK_001271 [Asimina triloba]